MDKVEEATGSARPKPGSAQVQKWVGHRAHCGLRNQ